MTTPLALALDRGDRRPLGAQLADQIRDRVAAGRLAPGERLPSSRALAADLAVARAVTEQAYAQLVAEGWLEGRRGAGTFVSGTAWRPGSPARRRRPEPPARALVRLDTGTPWIDPRHDALWRRAWREVSAGRPPVGYLDPRGLAELRTELAARLTRTRAVACDPDEVLVTSGTTDGLRHLLQALGPGEVVVEDPGYRAAVATARSTGRVVRDVPAELVASTPLTGAAAAYVTPAHQHPLGATMPAADRLALLAGARAAGTLVVEDDYDSEFRYDVAPLPALASLDREQVGYLGTASKTVAPSIRLGWMVLPAAVREAVERERLVTHDTAPWPVQRAFLALLRDGYVDKVVRSARRVYAERAARVRGALAPYGEITGPVAGMYATVLMPAARAEAGRDAARAAGYDVPLLADYCRSTVRHGLLVGFGGSTDDAGLDAALAALVRGLAQASG